MSIQQAIECIKKNESFLITTHTSPEGDALGSALSFYRLIDKLGKKAVIVNEDALPYGYDFLPDVQKIRRYQKGLTSLRFDVMVALDCSDLKRTGEVRFLHKANKAVLNIDHHVSNARFGSVNWVRPDASSCSEMIFEIYKKMNVGVDQKSALLLYVGIMTDTGSFRYSNTSPKTHRIVAELISRGLDVPALYHQIYENIPYADMELLTRILPTMQSQCKGRVVWFEIKKRLLKKQKNISFDLTEHILTFARSIKGVEVALLFRENLTEKESQVRVNFRSQGRIDVNKIAGAFGGGGHCTASGATVKGSLNGVKRNVLRKIAEAFGQS